MDQQAIQRKVGLIAEAGCFQFDDDGVLECRRGVADFGKTINPAGTRKGMRDTLDSIQRVRQPVALLQNQAIR